MKKSYFYLLLFSVLFIPSGCSSLEKSSSVIDKIIKTPGGYIETLKHPTKFPEEFLPEVLNIDDIISQNPLSEGENVKILLVGESKLSSTHFVQVREGCEIKPHFHEKHDKTISIKRGKGIAVLNGTRYLVEPGMVIQVPSSAKFKFINTGTERFVALYVFTPPFDGKDIKYIKEEVKENPESEAQKEKNKLEKEGKTVVLKDENRKDEKVNNKNMYNPEGTTNKFNELENKFENDKYDSSTENYNESTKHDLSGTLPYKSAVKDTKSSGSENSGNDVNDMYTHEDEQTYTHDLNNDNTLDGEKKIGNEFMTDDIDSLIYDTEFDDNDSGNVPYPSIPEDSSKEFTKSNEFVYDSNKDFLDKTDKTKESYEYAADDVIFDTEELSISEDGNVDSQIEELNRLKDSNLITEDEYRHKIAELLKK